jgi:transposase
MRKHVHKETSDELNDIETHFFNGIVIRPVTPGKGDTVFREFNDAAVADCDAVRVAAEIFNDLLRRGDSVVDVCRRFGITRQSFYTLQEKLLRQGTAGLLPRKPGPRGPSKLTEELLAFINQQVQQDQNVSIMSIINDVQVNFGVSLHRRTIEKLVKNLRVKKNFTSHHRDEPCQ